MEKKETKKIKAKPKAAAKAVKVSAPEKKVKKEKIKETKSAVAKKPVEKAAEKVEAAPIKQPEKKKVYLCAVGRRKCGIAQVKINKNGKGVIIVNGKDYKQYFPFFEFQEIVTAPLRSVGQSDKLDVEVKVNGGGKRGQAEAVRLGISRALINLNPNFKKNLRRAGFLTRDPRVKERKKYGLKRARRAPQWQKR